MNEEGNLVLRIVGVVAGAMILFVLIYLYFGTHFFFGSRVAKIEVGGLSLAAAEQKIRQETRLVEVKLKGEEQTITLQVAAPYEVQREYLKQNIRRGEFNLPLKKNTKEKFAEALNQASFLAGKEAQNAKVVYRNKKFTIESEEAGTMIDSTKIRRVIFKAIDANDLRTEYPLADFYHEPEITKKDLENKKILQKLEAVRKRGVKLKLNKQTIPLSEKRLATSVNEQGDFDQALIAEWVAELERNYSTIYQPMDFTNIHGQHLRFKNVGNYGWFIDIEQSAEKIAQKLRAKNTKVIQLVLQGETKKQPLHITKNYIEVDLDNQKMYCFNKGKLVVETDVITGQYTKGTATVPGFHTIMDKRRNVDLSGVLTTGDGTYSVPVDYWMPLLSHGQTITEIGLHDTDHKLQYFGQPEVYRTELGSYGCVNTPKAQIAQIYEYSFIGMPVFIYGHIYDDAPGEFDKPVEHGTVI